MKSSKYVTLSFTIVMVNDMTSCTIRHSTLCQVYLHEIWSINKARYAFTLIFHMHVCSSLDVARLNHHI